MPSLSITITVDLILDRLVVGFRFLVVDELTDGKIVLLGHLPSFSDQLHHHENQRHYFVIDDQSNSSDD